VGWRSKPVTNHCQPQFTGIIPPGGQLATMSGFIDYPIHVLVISLAAQCVAVYIGDLLRRRGRSLTEDQRKDFGTVQGAALTLLALIIGFSFSMAVTRYDQRKNYEEAEANAIGTAYVRADLLPDEGAKDVRELLKRYLDQRILFYLTRDEQQINRINSETRTLQADLWSTTYRAANSQPTPLMALAVAGMNDVLNAQGYTQAAWWNRIPIAAWAMMGLIAISSNFLVGYGEHRRGVPLLLVLRLIISIPLFLIADIDSPRGGIIRVIPQNLVSLSQSLKVQ
jgi:hypothetical protein